jgi:sugar transferase (PEP-CTERM/EpsH1 system associated)
MELLVVLSRVPYPLDKGDKLRAYHQLKLLSESHNISLFCLNEGKIHPEAKTELKKLCKRVEVVQFSKFRLLLNLVKSFKNKLPFQVNYFLSKKAKSKFEQFCEDQIPDLIYCQLVRTAEYVKKYQTIPLVLDYMDSLSSAMSRRSKTSNWFFKNVIKNEANRLSKYEDNLASVFHAQTIISKQDFELLPLHNKSNLQIIPNGVDLKNFKPIETAKDFDFVFVGNMAYPPNVDAVCYFAEEIFPLILEKKPESNFLISGTQPTSRVIGLASKNIKITGFVKDITNSYARAKVFVAPLRQGAGLQNKLLEAMAMELPFVSTPIAYNALGLAMDSNLCADNKIAFAENCIKFIDDEKLRNSTGKALRQFTENQYSWQMQSKKLNEIFNKLIQH